MNLYEAIAELNEAGYVNTVLIKAKLLLNETQLSDEITKPFVKYNASINVLQNYGKSCIVAVSLPANLPTTTIHYCLFQLKTYMYVTTDMTYFSLLSLTSNITALDINRFYCIENEQKLVIDLIPSY